MSAIDSKYHLKVGEFGFVLARQARTERHIYAREEAPHFVNKFSSGDPNYRDATFFPHWAQINFLNGFDQEFFDDGGKFFRSSAVNPTDQEKLTLQKAMESAGTVTNAGVSSFGLRSSSSASAWWDTNYSYSQRLTITAPDGIAVPQGHPIQVTIDTAALETASKVESDRDDWRIVYDNGITLTDLTRDYVTTTNTVFGLQAAIAAGGTDDNYYAYYGYTAESTNKQPTDDAGWNEVYGMFGGTNGEAISANTLAIYHFDATSGTTLTDRDGSVDMTTSGVDWDTDGVFGRAGGFGDSTDKASTTSDTFNLGSMTIRAWVRLDSTGSTQQIIGRANGSDVRQWQLGVGSSGNPFFVIDTSSAHPMQATGSSTMSTGVWYQVAGTCDGSGAIKVYLNGVLDGSNSNGESVTSMTSITTMIGRKDTGGADAFDGSIAHISIGNTELTSFPHALASEPTSASAGEEEQGAALGAGIFEIYSADNAGSVYLWDGATTWTEQFDVRRLKWYDDTTLSDGDGKVGDDAGTEKARAQSFLLDEDTRIKGVELYIKKLTGTPGIITVKIETDNSDAPSGTLADASLTGTIAAFTDTTYAWITLDFDSVSTANLTAATKYWITMTIPAGSNDNNYAWGADTSSPTYSDGSAATSTDGGSTWAAQASDDMMFRVLGESTKVNQMAQSQVGGTSKLWLATGDPDNTRDNNARMYSYDGTDWVLEHTFDGTGTAAALSLQVYESQLFVGLSPRSKIYLTTDGTTWTESKDIDQPDNPGYPYDMEVYNQRLYVCGGHPEYTKSNNSLGYLWSYDNFTWQFTYDFSFTVVKSLKVFDGLMFIGTINKKLYVFNTASIDKLFEFPWDVSIDWMDVWDDKLAIGLNGTDSLTGEEAVYLFDRNGFHRAFTPSSVGITSGIVARNQLITGNTGTTIHKIADDTYADEGTLQSSYFEAQLPNIYKLYRNVTLMFDSLPTGGSIKVDYKTDETDSWTNLGTASTAGTTSESFNFASGVFSHKISFRYTLATTDTTKTPTLRKSIAKYVLSPDFKYMWKMKLACPDNMQWLDNTEPVAILGANITALDTTMTLDSNDNATPTNGFPDPNGETMQAAVELADGTEDVFTYTGKTDTTLTGIPSSGTYALDAHTAPLKVRVRGADLHQKILDLKQTRQLFTYTDIDGITYTVFFHSYQSDNWVINPEDIGGGMENEVPITLLEA